MAMTINDIPTPDVSGLAAIDDLVRQNAQFLADQGNLSRKSLLQSRKKLRQERRAGRRETRLMRSQLDLLRQQMEPEAPMPGLTMAEVENARQQTLRDANMRQGMRKSIVAGGGVTTASWRNSATQSTDPQPPGMATPPATGPITGILSPITGRKSLLGPRL